MINHVYQLIQPHAIAVKFKDDPTEGKVIVRPEYMAVCHADQRYYQGRRPPEILKKKLPMALIHECCGRVAADDSGTFQKGQRVVLIPNTPVIEDPQIYENYRAGSYFLSSGHDGFMREMIPMDPDRVVALPDRVPNQTAAITEFLSVCAHAADRFGRSAHDTRERIGIWGDGSLSYCMCLVLKELFPNARIAVIGMQPSKLSMFSFVDERYLNSDIPAGFAIDHAFECAGGEGSAFAIDDIIRTIRPQGNVMLLGVSENKVPVYTRDVLEKGLVMIGCSRSGRADFESIASMLSREMFCNRLERIVYDFGDVKSIDDIHRVFEQDLLTPFKTAFRWHI